MSKEGKFETLLFSTFEFVSGFGIRVSDFPCAANPAAGRCEAVMAGKFEIRSTKSETNLNVERGKIRNIAFFESRICFGFRYSSFGFSLRSEPCRRPMQDNDERNFKSSDLHCSVNGFEVGNSEQRARGGL
jgi:hypothetical protein